MQSGSPHHTRLNKQHIGNHIDAAFYPVADKPFSFVSHTSLGPRLAIGTPDY